MKPCKNYNNRNWSKYYGKTGYINVQQAYTNIAYAFHHLYILITPPNKNDIKTIMITCMSIAGSVSPIPSLGKKKVNHAHCSSTEVHLNFLTNFQVWNTPSVSQFSCCLQILNKYQLAFGLWPFNKSDRYIKKSKLNWSLIWVRSSRTWSWIILRQIAYLSHSAKAQYIRWVDFLFQVHGKLLLGL